MPLMTDLIELKTILEIPFENTQEDSKLLFLMEYATSWIEEILNRPGLFYRQRTEYYNGTGTQKLLLKSRPVFPENMQVYVNQQGYYGANSGAFQSNTQLTYGSNYVLWIDQDDGSSRNGILLRINGYWPRPFARQQGWLTSFISQDTGSVKVVYYGGYTVDSLPSQLRLACNILVSKMRYLMPVGMELSSEGYEERSISIVNKEKDYLLSTVKDLILTYRNWKW